MRKPDIFDEIIQCLRDTGVFSPSASVSPEILDDLFGPLDSSLLPRCGKQGGNGKKNVSPGSDAFRQESVSGVSRADRDPGVSRLSVLPERKSSPAAAEPRHPESDRPAPSGWEKLLQEVSSCRKCPLHGARTHVVFGEGNPEADLMFIGEGPGADEDRQGRPFVGRAGELLTKMIHAMQFNREDVYIANIVKCRPPNNRVPEESEAALCMPYLERQIELVKPRVMVLLGATPVKYITGLTGITKLRGRWLEYRGIKVMPTFHPAYLLRNPPAKAPVWQDLQMVMKEFGKTFPGKGKK